jgi:hypothetical protein
VVGGPERGRCDGEQHVRRLRLAVGDEGVVRTPLEVDVVEVDLGVRVADRADDHDPGAGGSGQRRV